MDHWRMVPIALRRPVLKTFRALANSKLRYGRYDLGAVKAYREAVANAVAALATKQTKKNDDRAALEGDLFAQPVPAEHGQLLKEEHGNNNEPGREPAEGGCL
jgi:hypothetical protein